MSSDARQTPTIVGVAGPPEAWGWALGSGLVLTVAGLVALCVPGRTTVAIAFFLSWVLLAVGIAGIVMGIRSRLPRRKLIDFLYGIGSLGLGGILFAYPRLGAYTVTAAFAIWLILRGATELLAASHTGFPRYRTGLIVTGLVNWLLAGLLLANFPSPAVKVIGLFVGISFLVSGLVTIVAAFQLRRLAHA